MPSNDKKKNIWIVNHYASTPNIGMGGRSFYLAREFARKGHIVTVIAASYSHLLHKPPRINGFLTDQKIENMQFVWVRVPSYKSPRSIVRIMNWFRFSFALRHIPKHLSHTPDIIICSSPSLISWLGVEWISRKIHAKLFFDMRDIWPLTLVEIGNFNYYHPFILFLRFIEARAYKNSDIITSNMKYAYEYLETQGIERNKFHWVPNGYCADEFQSTDNEIPNFANSIIQKKFVIGYVGTVGLANALHTLVDAAEILSTDKKFHFVIIGDGSFKSHLIKKTKLARLTNITFEKAISKRAIPSAIKKFDACYIGALDSPLYRFGAAMNKIAEYFQSERPILWGINAGRYKPVSEANCGIETEPENAIQLSAAIRDLSNLPTSERMAMGKRAKKYANKHFEYRLISDSFEKLF